MCPLCVSTAALVAIGATSAGGLAGLLAHLRSRSVAGFFHHLFRNKGGQNEPSANRIAR